MSASNKPVVNNSKNSNAACLWVMLATVVSVCFGVVGGYMGFQAMEKPPAGVSFWLGPLIGAPVGFVVGFAITMALFMYCLMRKRYH